MVNKETPRGDHVLEVPALYFHPPCAYSLFPTAVPVNCPQNTHTMYAVFTRFLALGLIV